MFAISTPLRPVALSLAAAAGAMALGASPAAARDAAPAPAVSRSGTDMIVTQVPVSLADLNLTTAQGRSIADRRVRAAARQACAIGMGKVTLEQSQDQLQCFNAALRQGKVQLALARQQVLASR